MDAGRKVTREMLVIMSAESPIVKRRLVLKVIGVAIVVIAMGLTLKFASDYYESRAPGRFGHDLEIRLLALDGGKVNSPVDVSLHDTLSGEDVFSATDAKRLSESGETPDGWQWMPLAASEGKILKDTAILHQDGDRLLALVANKAPAILTHTNAAGAWGIKSVEINERHDDPGDTSLELDLELDEAGGKLIGDLSNRYLNHYLAVVIKGTVIMAPKVNDVIGQSFVIQLGERESRQMANRLRDELLYQ